MRALVEARRGSHCKSCPQKGGQRVLCLVLEKKAKMFIYKGIWDVQMLLWLSVQSFVLCFSDQNFEPQSCQFQVCGEYWPTSQGSSKKFAQIDGKLAHQLHGGMAGGANATSRKRKEKMLREGLPELFKNVPNMICQKKEIILPHHSVKPVIVRMNGRQRAGKRKPNRLLSPPKITLIFSRTCRRLSTVALTPTTQMVYCKNCKIWWTNIYSSEQIPARHVRFDATASNTKHVALASSDVKNAWKLAPSFWHTSCKDQCQYSKRSEQGSVLKRLPKLASSIAESFCELYITYWLNSSNRENFQSDRKSAPMRQDNVPVLRKIANAHELESPHALVRGSECRSNLDVAMWSLHAEVARYCKRSPTCLVCATC